MSTDSAKIDKSKLIFYIAFFVTVIGLAVISIFFTFKGLSSPRAMEQAQIGREIARGNGYTTKVIRPVSIWQMEKNNKDIPNFQKFPDTYHAPLNPLVYGATLKAVGGENTQKWRIAPQKNIYELDRIIATVCIIFFLIAIGVNYLLISSVFDRTIASVTALLMLFCELMWQFSQSGLPQMLMLMLFSIAMLNLWKAVEKSDEGKNTLVSIFLAGLFMCLLVLTHWITIWVYIGFTIFAAIYFKPRGVIAALLIGMLAIFVIPVIYLLYMAPSGGVFGTALFAIHDGLGFSEDYILRSLSPENQELGLNGLLLKILSSTFAQFSYLHENLGAIIVAPLFFIALLHPFKKSKIRSFRWLILLMWMFASIGMTIYGTKDGTMDSNQIHILFAPLMTAYGLAIISILWARLEIPQGLQTFRYSHLIIISIISIGPMALSLPKNLKQGISAGGRGGIPHLPYYYPPSLNKVIADNTTNNETIIADTPWAVAWYADRPSVWLPHNVKQIEKVESIAKRQQNPVSGIFISPYSFNNAPIIKTAGASGMYKSLYPLVYGAWATQGNAKNFLATHPKFRGIIQRYPNPQPLLYEGYMMYYSKRPLTQITN